MRRRDESFHKSNSDIQTHIKANVSDATTGSCNFHMIFVAGFIVLSDCRFFERALSGQWDVFKNSRRFFIQFMFRFILDIFV